MEEEDILEVIDNEIYKDEKVVVVKMRVKDYRTLMEIITRQQSMSIIVKYALGLLGAIITVITAWKLGALSLLKNLL